MRNLLFFFLLLHTIFSLGQSMDSINWITMEEMEEKFTEKPNYIIVDFWAEWCKSCKRMDDYTFKNPDVISFINQNFYAVKLDSETKREIRFGGVNFVNSGYINTGKQSYHDLAFLLGKNSNNSLSLPLILVFDTTFSEIGRINKYLSSERLLNELKIIHP